MSNYCECYSEIIGILWKNRNWALLATAYDCISTVNLIERKYIEPVATVNRVPM